MVGLKQTGKAKVVKGLELGYSVVEHHLEILAQVTRKAVDVLVEVCMKGIPTELSDQNSFRAFSNYKKDSTYTILFF